MGIDVRVDALKSQASPERADEIEKAAKRLTDLTDMGKRYRVLGFTSDAVPGEGDGLWPLSSWTSRSLSNKPSKGISIPRCAYRSLLARGNPSVFGFHKLGTQMVPSSGDERARTAFLYPFRATP